MILMTILMMVLMVNVIGFAFRLGFGILRGFFRIFGFLFLAGLVITYGSIFLLPVLIVIGLIALVVKGTGRNA